MTYRPLLRCRLLPLIAVSILLSSSGICWSTNHPDSEPRQGDYTTDLMGPAQYWPPPLGIDLDVTYIQRVPLYSPYVICYVDSKPHLCPGTEGDPRWPAYGETVTFTAHFINKGTLASGPFEFDWRIDGGVVASGSHPGLAPAEEGTADHQWVWAHQFDGERLLGEHTVAFEVDPGNMIAETYESNNLVEDRTDAMSFALQMTQEAYDDFEVPVHPMWPYSAEDWVQKQLSALNDALQRSIHPLSPIGALERVRLDQFAISETALTIPGIDGNWILAHDERVAPGYDPKIDVSDPLLHELTHQLGIIDVYNIGGERTSDVLDASGHPVLMSAMYPEPGLMASVGTEPPSLCEHSAVALNLNKGFRRGYYGEYMFDMPSQARLKVLDNTGSPAPGVGVRLFQRSGSMYGLRFDGLPELELVTDSAGETILPNRAVGAPLTTATGHTLSDNPYGVIDIVGQTNIFLVEINAGAHQEYGWLDVTELNRLHWAGGDTLTLSTHVPAAGAPEPPALLFGLLQNGTVETRWTDSPSPGVVAYNVYRTVGLRQEWTLAAAGVVGNSEVFTALDGGQWGKQGFAVTAVDDSGYESGFSNLFWTISVLAPTAIALDGSDTRVVVSAAANAVVSQDPWGAYLDYVAWFDPSFAAGAQVAVDPAGRILATRPPENEVVVLDRQRLRAVFPLGEPGSGPGQFNGPTGIAVWGDACSSGGPYPVDAHTLLLTHFDGVLLGEQGEVPSISSGTSFAAGIHGQAVKIEGSDVLAYPTSDNINPAAGAIEMWVQPEWDGDDGVTHVFFNIGEPGVGQVALIKDAAANNVIFFVCSDGTCRDLQCPAWFWQSSEWHHIAAAWRGAQWMLFTDGELCARESWHSLPDPLSDTLFIGQWDGACTRPANALIDELRISDLARFGDSDSCSYRLLVADSGNHRLQAFDMLGNFVVEYGTQGSGPGQFDNPLGLAVDSGARIVVADHGNDRVQLLSFDGATPTHLLSMEADFAGPTAVATDAENHIFVADTGNDVIKELDAAGGLLAEYDHPAPPYTGVFDGPEGVAVDSLAALIVADTGNHRVVVAGPPRCPDLECLTIMIDPPAVCAGDSQTLTVQFSGGLAPVIAEWDLDGDGSVDLSANPVAVILPEGYHTISVAVSDSCFAPGPQTCALYAPTAVAAIPEPVIFGPTVACGEVPVQLDAGAGFSSYLWSPGGEVTQTITVNPTVSTVYSVEVSGTTGCLGNDSLEVVPTTGTPPDPTIAGAAQMCAGDTTVLDAGAEYLSYLWSPGGETTRSISVSPSRATEYAVLVTGAGGCQGTDAHTLAVNASPAPAITASDYPGIPDPTWPVADLPVYALAEAEGVLYVGGDFAHFGGQPRNGLAAVDLASGSLLAWNPNATGTVRDIEVIDSTVYVVGNISSVGGEPRALGAAVEIGIGAVLPWNPGADGTIHTVEALASTLLIGGSFTHINGVERSHLAAVDSAAGNPTDWNPGADNTVLDIEERAGTVYVGGNFSAVGGEARAGLAAINALTAEVTDLDIAVNGAVYSLAVANGMLYLGGQFTTVGGIARASLAAIDTASGTVEAWDPSANGTVYSISATPTRMFAAGNFSVVHGATRMRISSLDPVSGHPHAWNPGANGDGLACTAVGSSFFVGGGFGTVGGQSSPAFAAFVDDGFSSGCAGELVYLAASHAAGHRWFLDGTEISGETNATLDASISGSYTAEATWANGCAAVSPAYTVVLEDPVPVISGPFEICAGEQALLDAGSGYASYLWSNGETTQTINVSPSTTTAYTVFVTTQDGCPGTSDPHTLQVVDCSVIFVDGFESGDLSAWSASYPPEGR